MSYPLMRAVPDVGGNSPVRIDLQRREEVNKTQDYRAADALKRRVRSSWLNIMAN